MRLIDAEYDLMAQNAEPHAIEKSKKELGRMETILGADQTIAALCEDIVGHYEENRQHELTGKAMIVACSRAIAMSIYRGILRLRPEWTEKVGVVMTEDNQDPDDWNEVIGNKRRRDNMAKKFKDSEDPLKIAIVVDMWLTGFDVPCLATMYVYKPMAGHNLMQAIACVNRVFSQKTGDTIIRKEGGLVVDYVGIAAALKQAMRDYTGRDKRNYGDREQILLYWNIGKTISKNIEYGNSFIFNLARDIKLEFPDSKGYSERNLRYMRKFAEIVTDAKILQTLSAKLKQMTRKAEAWRNETRKKPRAIGYDI